MPQATATLTKTPKALIGDLGNYRIKSATTKARYTVKVDSVTGRCSCTCPHFTYRLAKHDPRITDAPEKLCKHLRVGQHSLAAETVKLFAVVSLATGKAMAPKFSEDDCRWLCLYTDRETAIAELELFRSQWGEDYAKGAILAPVQVSDVWDLIHGDVAGIRVFENGKAHKVSA